MFALVAFALLALPGASVLPAPPAAAAHNFHVSYGRMAVQGQSATLQVRFFRDDLEEALKAATGAGSYRVEATPAVDAVFLAYLRKHLVVTAGGQVLEARVVGSGEENDMWWYRLQYSAPSELRTFSIRNTLLFDAFDDQRNIFKVMYFPGEQVETLYFTEGADRFTVRF